MWDARISPDGQTLAGEWQSRPSGIYLSAMDGSGTSILDEGGKHPLGWSADGRFVFGLDDALRELWQIPVDGSAPTRLTTLTLDRVTDGVVINDSTFVFVVPGANVDVWVMENFDPGRSSN